LRGYKIAIFAFSDIKKSWFL